jgi:tetratricopeptide (TPR) repeat protein
MDLDFLIARVHARFALVDPARQDAAIKKLEAFRRAHSTSFRFYETLNYLGQVYLAKQDLEQAKSTFAEMRSAPLKAYQMTADVATARVLLAEKDIDGARKLFSQVADEQVQQPTELSLKHEAMLGKATCEQRSGNFDQAITTLDSVINNASPQDSRIQAEAYLRQGDCLQAAKKLKPAVLAYLHVDVLFSNEKALHPEALYHLARLWGSVGHPERAAEAQSKLSEGYPNNPWTKKFAAGK